MRTDAQFDQLQNAVNILQDDVEVLKRRLAALESGEPLPADQKVEFVVETPATPVSAVKLSKPESVPELDLSRGMTTGQRGGN